jgi:ubiquinone/menaquinone biosynthesis C-methylase UbiE
VKVSYQGCDFSPAFIRIARQIYPAIRFDVEDATRLSYDADSFDIVVSGCCLLHIPEYEKAIAEAARVSREFVVFHRTPVLHMMGPVFFTKNAYGVEMLEIHFNEQQLVRMFAAHNLHLVDVNSHVSLPENRQGDVLFYKTYLCRKAK